MLSAPLITLFRQCNHARAAFNAAAFVVAGSVVKVCSWFIDTSATYCATPMLRTLCSVFGIAILYGVLKALGNLQRQNV